MKAENVIGPASVVKRPDRNYLGIRISSPFPGMFANVSKEWKLLRQFAKSNKLEEAGRYFLRYYHCDMAETMEVEISLFCDSALDGKGSIKPGLLPGGKYASLTYRGNGLRGNQALMKWANDKGLEFEKIDPEKKESYVSRYEAYLADCRLEPRKLLWNVELSIKLV